MEAWGTATLEESHQLLSMMLDGVYVDMAQGLVLGLKPKPGFLPLFNLGEPVTTGDSELVTGWMEQTPTPDTLLLCRDHGGKKRGVFRLRFDIDELFPVGTVQARIGGNNRARKTLWYEWERTSNPLCLLTSGVGGFDSLALPPDIFRHEID